MATRLDCSADLKTALLQQVRMALTLLSKWEGCNVEHADCPFRGEDCAVQDLIEGFFVPADDGASHEAPQ